LNRIPHSFCHCISTVLTVCSYVDSKDGVYLYNKTTPFMLAALLGTMIEEYLTKMSTLRLIRSL
jgi:hypothetical protein